MLRVLMVEARALPCSLIQNCPKSISTAASEASLSNVAAARKLTYGSADSPNIKFCNYIALKRLILYSDFCELGHREGERFDEGGVISKLGEAGG